MTPTPKLRFLELDGPMMGFYKGSDGAETAMYQKIRILQQWWEDSAGDLADGITAYGEWKDVPCERE